MKIGDWRKWRTENLYKNLTRVILAKQAKQTPYYIQVQLQPRYDGPPAASTETKDMQLKGKVHHEVLVLMDTPPDVPMLGTILFRVDNKIGKIDLIYSLPVDKPNRVEDSDNYGDIVPQVAEQMKRMGAPLIWS